MTRLKDIMLETETIGLAEKLAPVAEELFVEVETPETLAMDAKYYFGLELSTGDICEACGSVAGSFEDAGKRVYKLKIVECDENFVALIAATLSPKTAPDEKNAGGPTWAFGLKQTNSSYAIIVNSPAGFFTSKHLETIAGIAAKGYGITKLTHAQRIVILVKPEQLLTVEEELTAVGLRKGVLHHGIRNVRACAGALCKWSKNNDAIGLSVAIDTELYGFSTKFDVKIAVSDCLRNCSESYCADIGLIGFDGDYRVVVGGRGSSVPFRAIELISKLPKDRVVGFIRKFVDWYASKAVERERLCKTLQRLGNGIFEAKPEAEKASIKSAFGCIDGAFGAAGDGVSESARMFEQYLRALAVESIKKEFAEVR